MGLAGRVGLNLVYVCEFMRDGVCLRPLICLNIFCEHNTRAFSRLPAFSLAHSPSPSLSHMTETPHSDKMLSVASVE